MRSQVNSERDSRPAIVEVITRNASRGGLQDPVVTVARDPRGGYRIRVVHAGLAGLAAEDRETLLLAGIEEPIADSELLTPIEEEWYGPAFAEGSNQVSWPDALSAPPTGSQLVFASDLDQDLEPPAIVTFYSFQGGVGRTTALASAASVLASRGRRVLCIDMDLEAPGLSLLMGVTEPDDDEGVVPMLLALERGDEVDIRDHLQRVSDVDELYCLPAGRLSADYAERLRLIDPESWYLEKPNPLYRLIESAEGSPLNLDIILIDSRTGISPASAPLLFDISDLAVICFFPHPQARRGTELPIKALLNSTSRRSAGNTAVTPEPRFIVSPMPPGPSARQVQMRALEWIDEWLSDEQSRRAAGIGPLLAEELTHFISYSAEVAFQDDVLRTARADDSYTAIADWLEQLLPQAPR